MKEVMCGQKRLGAAKPMEAIVCMHSYE